MHLGRGGGDVIPWSSPVPSFGDLEKAAVATLGINPSNREFVDSSGRELDGTHRRFHTLRSLGLESWQMAKRRHYEMIWKSCAEYFQGRPYDTWFKQLDEIIGGAGFSYYTRDAAACHLDLVPYATARKWTDLRGEEKTRLLAHCNDILGNMIAGSRIRLLILNGQTVVEEFEAATQQPLKRRTIPEWELPRKSGSGVAGIAYSGIVQSIGGVPLGRSLVVLGFNHNIQSSFGVTRLVRASIRQWIGREARRTA